MSLKITWIDKILHKLSSLPANQKWTFEDANEVKEVVNSHADDIEALQNGGDVSDAVPFSIAQGDWIPGGEGVGSTHYFVIDHDLGTNKLLVPSTWETIAGVRNIIKINDFYTTGLGITDPANQIRLEVNAVVDIDGIISRGGSSFLGDPNSFTGLNDSPDEYLGQGGKFVKVKLTEDGVEFGGAITDGNGTTANGTSVDLGSVTPLANDVYLGGNGLVSWNFGLGPGNYFTSFTTNTMNYTLNFLKTGGSFVGSLLSSDTEISIGSNSQRLKFKDSLNETVFEDTAVIKKGIQYNGDYRGSLVGESLVPKNYVDTETETKVADFTLSNDGGKRFLVDSATDVTVTVDTGAGTDLKNITFVKMNTGNILISVLGTATVNIPSNKSAVIGTQYNTGFLQEISTDVFIWSGETN